MDSVFRALAIYAILALLFRVTGRRSLSQITTFDFVLLLVVGDATSEALLGGDPSFTNLIVVIVTLMATDIVLAWIKGKRPGLVRALEGQPTLLVLDGRPLEDRMAWSRISREDVLQAAREGQGVLRMEDIRVAVLEPSGSISIIPKETAA